MAYYIDTDSFQTASGIWLDAEKSDHAPDGYYGLNGIYREVSLLVLQPAQDCDDCVTTSPPTTEAPTTTIDPCNCKEFNLNIDQADLSSAIGNSDPTNNLKVFLSYTDCTGLVKQGQYVLAGQYTYEICADVLQPITLAHFVNNVETTGTSSASNTNISCCSEVPTTTLAPEPCGTPVQYNGGVGWPTLKNVSVGLGTGALCMITDARSVPDRFIVKIAGSIVIDTNWRGSTNYDLGGTLRESLFHVWLSGQIDPITGVAYPDLTNFPDDGYPRVLGGIGDKYYCGTKSTEDTVASVEVYGSGPDTVWSYTLLCPGTDTTTTTTTSTTTVAPRTTTEAPTTTAAPTCYFFNLTNDGAPDGTIFIVTECDGGAVEYPVALGQTIYNVCAISVTSGVGGTLAQLGLCSAPVQPTSFYYGKINSPGSSPVLPSPGDIDIFSGSLVENQDATGSINIPFASAVDDYIWFAIPASVSTKTNWFVDGLNQGDIGGAVSRFGNLFPSPYATTQGLQDFKLYISNYRTNLSTITIS